MISRVFIGLLLVVSICGILSAANSTIGVAMTNGNFVLDRSTVVGNANVFDGSVIETGQAMSDLTLSNGLKLRLGTESRGQVFLDRLVLEKGAGQVSGGKYVVEAGRLRVMPDNSTATARVAFGSRNLVEVAAIGGPVRVMTAEGTPLANITAGSALSFTNQAGASTPTTLCGTVVRSNGKLMLTDTTTKVTLELKGADLDRYVGKSISVSGNMAGNDALQVLGSPKTDSCGVVPAGAIGAAGAAGAGATGAAGAGAAAGLSTAAIAGIAIAGATGLSLGLAGAKGAFSGSNASQ
jgi:hypothetical protein